MDRTVFSVLQNVHSFWIWFSLSGRVLGLSLGGQAFYFPGVSARLFSPHPCALSLHPASWRSCLWSHLLPGWPRRHLLASQALCLLTEDPR